MQVKFNPRPYQKSYWRATVFDGCLRSLLVWHRRSGKDEVALNRTCIAAHERVATYWHILPAYEQARKAIWNAINPTTSRRRIDEAFPLAIRDATNEAQMLIKLKCGSTWQLVGSDNFNSLVGTPPAGLVFSEWALSHPQAWGYLAPILLENGGWADFVTTPRGKNHVASMLDTVRKNVFDKATNPSGWFSEVLTVNDTGFDLDLVDQQREEYAGIFGEDWANSLIDQEFFCSFTAAILGAVYGREMIELEAQGRIVEELEPVAGIPVDTAWDLGVSSGNEMAIWWFQSLKDRILVLDYYEASGMGIEHFVKVKQERGYDYRGGRDYVPQDAKQRSWVATDRDGTARQRLEVMRDHGLNPVLIPVHLRADGISAARQTLRRCYFHRDRTEEGRAALVAYQYEWDEESRIFSREPLHNRASNGADAFRYLSMAWSGLMRKVPEPKPEHEIIRPFQPVMITTYAGETMTMLNFTQLRDRSARIRKVGKARIGERPR